VRPARCVVCGLEGAVPGRVLGLHGHGTRTRLQLGPAGLREPPEEALLTVRRYRCQRCSAELRDIWRYDVATGAWQSLPLGDVSFGHVLTSTYSAPEDRLFVLDETHGTREERTGPRGRRRGRSRPRTTIRLLSFGPGGGAARVEATWRRRSPNTRFAMSVDPSGAIFVAGSLRRARAHVVVRLVRGTDGSFDVDGWDAGRGGLHEAGVRASEEGVSVVGDRGPRRSPRIRFHATADLLRDRAGEAACF